MSDWGTRPDPCGLFVRPSRRMIHTVNRADMTKQKVTLTLPTELWEEIRQRVPARKLSQYVAEATAARLAEEERLALRARLKKQCLARASQDRRLADEFFSAEQEAADDSSPLG